MIARRAERARARNSLVSLQPESWLLGNNGCKKVSLAPASPAVINGSTKPLGQSRQRSPGERISRPKRCCSLTNAIRFATEFDNVQRKLSSEASGYCRAAGIKRRGLSRL